MSRSVFERTWNVLRKKIRPVYFLTSAKLAFLIGGTLTIVAAAHHWYANQRTFAVLRPSSSNPLLPEQAQIGPLRVGGGWIFVWKDNTGVLQRMHCHMYQVGESVRFEMEEPQRLHAVERKSATGSVDGVSLTFRVLLRNGNLSTYVGTMDNGILHGTDSQGESWMALPE